jgi:hypothetical protein
MERNFDPSFKEFRNHDAFSLGKPFFIIILSLNICLRLRFKAFESLEVV